MLGKNLPTELHPQPWKLIPFFFSFLKQGFTVAALIILELAL